MPGAGFPLLKKSLASPTFIVAIALVIRLLAIPTVVAKRPFHGNEPSHIAAHLAAGEGFSSPYDGVPNAPTAQQPPAYPFYLSLVFRMLGSFSRASLIFLLVANAAVGSLLPVLLYQAGRRWYGVSVGLIAAWCCSRSSCCWRIRLRSILLRWRGPQVTGIPLSPCSY
jgi:asparagine N-glycosylation enzyme membrane subunit Stt3